MTSPDPPGGATASFQARWHRFVRDWDALRSGEDPEAAAELVRQALATGLGDRVGAEAHPDPAVDLDCAVAVVAESGDFDRFGYFWHNPDLNWYLCEHNEEVRHFCRRGWREMRHPYPDFDVWFYWFTYLDPGSEEVNPYLHYLLEGRHRGLSTLPQLSARPPSTPPAADHRPRRICLYAGYDGHGLVDDTVVAYLADLSRFADIYYLADCPMRPGELEKLAPYTKGRWAIRHGRYDFGSYSMLAKELVGWEVIEEYDELILANDSCYLVQPFDQVFAKMDATVCDWWGLQATYEHFTVRDYRLNGNRPMGLDQLERAMRALELWRYSDFVHVGSYFLAYRRAVIDDSGFRARLDAVAAQSNKTAIILKYEIGFSRYLILNGFHLATFVDGVLPYHPVYRESAFDLMADGFPLLKRQFLYENPFSEPDLVDWQDRVLAAIPAAAVAAMEANLVRVAPPWNLARSFAIRTVPDGSVELPKPLGPGDFEDEDAWVPKFDHWWAFPVDPVTQLLTGDARAVFEHIRQDPAIKKLMLTGERQLALSGANVQLVPLDSAEGQYYLLRSRQILTPTGPRAAIPHPLDPRWHRFIEIGSGPMVARSPLRDDPDEEVRARYRHDQELTAAFVGRSRFEAMAGAQLRGGPVTHQQFWVTGRPRLDLLLGDSLPADLSRQVDDLDQLLQGRGLLLVRLSGIAGELQPLVQLAADRGLVLGVRPPFRWSERESISSGTEDGICLLPHGRFRDDEVLVRAATVLVSDDPGMLVDFLAMDRPAVSVLSGAPPAEDAPDPSVLLPNPVRNGTAEDWAAVAGRLLDHDPVSAGAVSVLRRLWHERVDAHNSARLVRRLRAVYLPFVGSA